MSDRKNTNRHNLIEIKATFEGKKVENSKSSAGNWLGFTLEQIEQGKAIICLTVKKEMTNPYGNIHGGMMSMVIDEAIGWAVYSLESEQHYTTLSLNVDFLYAIKEGEKLKAIANVIRAGKKIINVECFVYNDADKLLARGNSNLIATTMKFI